jgi:hypothetical protein
MTIYNAITRFFDINKLHWLSENPNAIELLKENPDKINWDALSQIPDEIDWSMLSIFTYDYSKITERPFVEELMSVVYHPDN